MDMKRRIITLAVVVIAALGVTLMVAGPAYAKAGAAGSNAECARCHTGAAVRSGVPAAVFAMKVDYSRCRTCHWLSGRTRSGYYTHRHQAGTACYACHAGYSSGPAYYPNVRTAAGYFATSDYTSLSAAEMHRIHASGSWPQSGTPAECASCHAPAACDACHAVPAAHSTHAYNSGNRDAQYAPVMVKSTRGTREGYADSVTARVQPLSCVNARCHVVSAGDSGISRPTCTGCHAPFAAFRAVAPMPAPTAARPSRTAARR